MHQVCSRLTDKVVDAALRHVLDAGMQGKQRRTRWTVLDSTRPHHLVQVIGRLPHREMVRV
jgi:hypothetical protein